MGLCGAKSVSPVPPAAETLKLRPSRTPSVVSLNSLLNNAVTYQAFLDFLHDVHNDALVHFLTAVRDFKSITPASPGADPNGSGTVMSERSFESIMRPSSSCPKGELAAMLRERQAQIFDTFLRKGAAMEIVLDSETVKDIEQRLPNADLNIFHSAVLKIYQQVKFDYLPRFLVSKNFQDVMTQHTGEGGSSTSSSSGHSGGVTLIEVLTDPVGCSCFVSFAVTKHREHWVQAWQEIESYTLRAEQMSSEADNRRARKIYRRYFEDASPVRLQLTGGGALQSTVAEVFKADADANGAADHTGERIAKHDMFQPALDMLMGQMQEELFEEFQDSRFYSAMNKYGDLVRSQAARTVEGLEEFAKKRKLNENKELMQQLSNLPFSEFLEDHSSTYYFRQFLVSEFNEESLLFYLEVKEFKAQRFAKPKFGTTIVDTDAMGQVGLMNKRAKKLLAKYIQVDSPFQVNLPQSIRDSTEQTVIKGPVGLETFDAAQTEICTMMEKDAFARFKESGLFKASLEHRMRHFMHRNYVAT